MSFRVQEMEKLNSLSDMVKEGGTETSMDKMEGMLKSGDGVPTDVDEQGTEFAALLSAAAKEDETAVADNGRIYPNMTKEEESDFLKGFHKNVTDGVQKDVKKLQEAFKKTE